MTPEKLRAWLNRERVGAAKLQLLHCTVDAEVMFQQWSLAGFEDGDIPVQVILDACADHADAEEEEIRVAIVFIGEDGEQVARKNHKARPADVASFDAANAGSVTPNAIVAQLLRHIEVQQRVMSASYIQIQNSYEKTIGGLHKERERMSLQIQALSEKLVEYGAAGGADNDNDTPESRTEALARADAWSKVAEYAPAVMQLVVQGVQSKLNGAGNGGTYHPPSGTDG